mgnify:CR=1 FL=1
MKKLLSGKFLVISATCLLFLIALTIGAFYLFDDSDNKFIKSGYVLNPLSEASEKYFFEKDTGYHKNLSSMVEFSDIDNNDVEILNDSFLHYNDESISFLKNGAILDLDSIHGSDAVKFYNITDSSIIQRDNNKYVIKSKNGDINIDNFIGRINDNKYIVVGDLQLKMAGNTTTVPGEYFEIVYVDEGIVNIENKDSKYQVMADDTLIRVGNDKIIDLGNKKITADNKDVMSITAITIDGDENIEIIPEVVKEEEKEEPDDINGNNNGNGNGENGNETGGGTEGGKEEDNKKTSDIVVKLKDVSMGSTNINVTFDILNASKDDNFTLRVVNLNSGKTVNVYNNVTSNTLIKVNLLTPNTKYLFSVSNDKTGNKYFQKIFETTGFGIKLEKNYATDESLSFRVIVDKDADITNAKLSLYKYNESTNKNEIVTTEYYDSVKKETVNTPKVTYISTLSGSLDGVYEITYDGLSSDTIYTAVLDEFSVASSNFKDIYNITITSMTLKKTPRFGAASAVKNNEAGTFQLSFEEVDDPDNAITKYTYMVYEKIGNKLVLDPVSKTSADPLLVKIGPGENELKNDVNYYYKVVIEYYDNEKYIEYVTTDSITFMMENDPYITVVANDAGTSYDTIAGTIYLTDNSCLVSMPDRENCMGENTTYLIISKINQTGTEKVYTKAISFDVTDTEIKYDFSVSGLEEDVSYYVDVQATLNNDPKNLGINILHGENSHRQITTKTLTSFIVSWDTENYSSDEDHVINAGVKFNVDEDKNIGTLSPEESMSSIKKIVLEMYKGNHPEDIQSQLPMSSIIIKNSDLDFKEKFYDALYEVTSDGTFGYTLNDLKHYDDSGLSEYYTLAIYAYYDNEGYNKVKLSNNVISYRVNRFLLMDNISAPEIEVVKEITNSDSGKIFSDLNNNGTIVGYQLEADFDRAGLLQNSMVPQKINFYVYDMSGKKVDFFILKNGKVTKVSSISEDLGDKNYSEQSIYMNYGTEYGVKDSVMSRGNKYRIGYEVTVLSDDDTLIYPSSGPGDAGNYITVSSEKETPDLKMYVAKSAESSIKYNYEIKDPDNAMYSEDGNDYKFYYSINSLEDSFITLNKVDADIKKFSGDFTITGLEKDDTYYMYYKKNITKTGNDSVDIVKYFDREDDGDRVFEGYYDASAYNFNYEVINNQLVDNKVTIKILADDVLLDRIVSYKLHFSDSKSNTLDKELWQLLSCPDDESMRCMTVDYSELKNAGMKSSPNNENIITVNVTALYDNGLMGYEYNVGEESGNDFKYMIMQNNNTTSTKGNYISFSVSGKLTAWNENLTVPKGYYTYKKSDIRITYYAKHRDDSSLISYNKSSIGFMSSYGVLNPKMISVSEMSSNKKTFSFDSITPKIAVSTKNRLIDGAVVSLNLSGVDLSDLVNEGSLISPDYYLYVKTWRNEDIVGTNDGKARPDVKVKINNSNPNTTLTAVLDGLTESTTYYYQVYAYMYKNSDKVMIQLFDSGYTDKYATKTYSFKSYGSSDVFLNVNTNYTMSKEVYGDRSLNTKINLISYADAYPYDFDLIYVLCETNDNTCGIKEESTNIFSQMISRDSLSVNITDTKDISTYDLEYNKNYNLRVYARMNVYDYENNLNELVVRDVLLNEYSSLITLNKLAKPSFVATREAKLTPTGEYAIDFKINVDDVNRTIVNGNYYIKLTDSSGSVAGTMQLLDDDGSYYTVGDYENYAFDAFVSNKSVRITNLDKDTRYTFVIYGDAYINNYDEDDEDLSKEEKIEKRTISVSSDEYAVYTVDDYGVAFGRDLLFSATEKSIVVTFLGGSNFENVTKVRYTIGLWNGSASTSTSSGVYDLKLDTNKKFELFTNSSDWRFVIDPSDMKNVLGQTYIVNMSFEVKTDEGNVWVTNSAFEGRTQYVED